MFTKSNSNLPGLLSALATVGFGALLTAAPASAAIIPVAAGSLTECPTTGFAHSCALVFRFNANGSVDTLTDSSVPSTDGIEDTLVGVLNNSGHVINSVFLDGGSLGIFGFDGDGQSTVPNPGSGPGATYFGRYFDVAGGLLGTTTFTPTNSFKGDVNFAGLTDGGSGWWVLEEQVSFTAPPIVGGNAPEPATVALLGMGLLGFAARRRKA